LAFNTVVIFSKPKQPDVARVAGELEVWLRERGVTATADPPVPVTTAADLAVVVGGDGTLLAAARALADHQIPILAINHGSLGFLTEVTLEQMYRALDDVLAGRFVTDRRMMMDIAVHQGADVAEYRALNDAVINKGTLARIIEIEARVDGQYVSTFRSDGIIVCTPTGSTAYNLSAGGPIIFPTMSAMVVTPICSHTLTNRPIVLPGDVLIEMTLKSQQDEVQLTVDGQVGLRLNLGDRVTVRKSRHTVQLIAPGDKNYFDVLRGKLKWG
jgi:Predicted sugar kinase